MMGGLGQARQRGFTIAEIAVVLAIIGVVIVAIAGGYTNLQDAQERDRAESHGEELRAALRTFAASHGRLPCPDTSAERHGWEGDCDGDPDIHTGAAPYRTLGVARPPESRHAFYGVHRLPAASAGDDADLARALDRTGDGRTGRPDLIRGLLNVPRAAPVPDTIHVARDADAGCGGAIRAVAFVVIIPLADRDGSGSRLDAPHPGLCALAPASGASATNDDVVITDSVLPLAAWLQKG